MYFGDFTFFVEFRSDEKNIVMNTKLHLQKIKQIKVYLIKSIF